MNENSKYPKNKIIVVAVILFLCAVAVAIVLVFTYKGSPKAKVMQAISNTLTAKDNSTKEYLHMDSFRKLIATGKLHTNMTLHLDDIKIKDTHPELESIVTLAPHITVDSLINYQDKKLLSSVDIGMGGSNLFHYDTHAEDTTIALECPMLFDGALSFDSSTLSKDYNASALSALLNTPALDDTVNFNLFDGKLSDETFLEYYKNAYEEDFNALYESLTVTKTDSMEISLGEESVKTNGYQLSIPREQLLTAFDNALEALTDFFPASQADLAAFKEQLNSASSSENFVCIVYIDPTSKKMVRLVHSDDYRTNGTPLHMDLNMDWTDTVTPMDHMKITLTCTDEAMQKTTFSLNTSGMENDGTCEKEILFTMDTTDTASGYNPVKLLFAYKVSPQNDTFEVSSSLENGNPSTPFYEISANGSFGDISAGKNLSMHFNSIALTLPTEDFQLELSGDYTLSAYEGEIASPESLRPIFELDENGLNALLYEAIRNLNNFPLLGSVLTN